jgi:hypothetical protein
MIGTPEKLKGVSNMNKVYLGFIAVLLCATVCAAQARKEQPNTLPNEKPQQSTPRDEKQGVLMSGTNINAELQKTLDVNTGRRRNYLQDEPVDQTKWPGRGPERIDLDRPRNRDSTADKRKRDVADLYGF